MTHVGDVITCTWVLFLVAVALDTKERVSYATVTRVASVVGGAPVASLPVLSQV